MLCTQGRLGWQAPGPGELPWTTGAPEGRACSPGMEQLLVGWMGGRADGPGHFPVTVLAWEGGQGPATLLCVAGQRLMTSTLSPGPRGKATSNPVPPLMASYRMKATSRLPQAPSHLQIRSFQIIAAIP